ncbi:MAG TPA: glycoside hydrolase family 38 C-terminal domain-containing protein [Candidatus Lokiarchaeia archaeon]|nr:glycoside hydrolase family 38 C-terminal domain-containing protein [Candidatus Lokiarchaeia archaeon]
MVKPVIHVIAQSHIDLAWLWRWDPETMQVCIPLTFGQAIANLDKFPNYTFSQSQVPLYVATEREHPVLFAKIEQYVKEGRWEIVGVMHVEAEGGEPSGESLVRQCIMGKRYFRQRFGVDVTTGWQEDSWTHPWQLPQIYAKCGVDSYFFKRGVRDPTLFWWEAPDGSRVLAVKPAHILHGFPEVKNRKMLKQWIDKCITECKFNHVMVRIGKGDHGGGPKPKDIAAVERLARKAAIKYDVKFDTFRNFVDAVMPEANNLPTLRTEINSELRGDLTNNCEIKQRNRECETLLLNAEKFATIAAILGEKDYPAQEMNDAWEAVLFNQFHDVIGGSTIPEATADAQHLYNEARERGNTVLRQSLQAICHTINTQPPENIPDPTVTPIVIFNPLAWERVDVVEIPLEMTPKAVFDASGSQIPFQVISSPILNHNLLESRPSKTWCLIEVQVPALGYATYFFSFAPDVFQTIYGETKLIINEYVMENPFYKITLDPATGNIAELIDKETQWSALNASNRGNAVVIVEDLGDSEGRFKKHDDLATQPLGPREDAAINVPDSEETPINPPFVIVENGPIRERVRIRKKLHQSFFDQDIALFAHLQRIDCLLHVDWHDIHRMVKLIFPTSVQNPIATYDTAYGTIVRPTDHLEYPTQKWVDLSSGAVSDGQGCGMSIINHTRYAHDVEGSTIGLSVLRSPTRPARNTEEGVHFFNYAILPHAGDWKSADTMRKAYEFNVPLIPVQDSTHPGQLPLELPFFSTSARNVIAEVVKRAYDSSEWVLRCFEFHGLASEFEISTFFAVTGVEEVDLLEQPSSVPSEISWETRQINVNVKPFEIKTLKIMFQIDNEGRIS